jgi:hypothetical protein
MWRTGFQGAKRGEEKEIHHTEFRGHGGGGKRTEEIERIEIAEI